MSARANLLWLLASKPSFHAGVIEWWEIILIGFVLIFLHSVVKLRIASLIQVTISRTYQLCFSNLTHIPALGEILQCTIHYCLSNHSCEVSSGCIVSCQKVAFYFCKNRLLWFFKWTLTLLMDSVDQSCLVSPMFGKISVLFTSAFINSVWNVLLISILYNLNFTDTRQTLEVHFIDLDSLPPANL